MKHDYFFVLEDSKKGYQGCLCGCIYWRNLELSESVAVKVECRDCYAHWRISEGVAIADNGIAQKRVIELRDKQKRR